MKKLRPIKELRKQPQDEADHQPGCFYLEL